STLTPQRGHSTRRSVQKEHCDPPQRHELEAPHRQCVIAGAGDAADGTHGSPILAWTYLYLKDRSLLSFLPFNGAIDKTRMQLHPIQDRLEQHPVLLSAIGLLGRNQ